MRQTDYDAVIVGAGHNGLVTAGYLAAEGLSVLVLERQDIIGGACVTEELYPGFRVPYCSYVCYLLQGKVIDDLRLRDHGLEIIQEEYGWFHPFPDGSYIQWGPRAEGGNHYEEIAKFSEHDAKVYPEWEAFWERAAGIIYRYWLREPPTLAQVFEDVRGTRDEEVWETMLTVPLTDLLNRYFESDHVKAYNAGGNPGAPGSVWGHAYYACARFSKPENVGIPRGSMGSITQAMARSAQALGVEIRTGTLVDRILVEKGVARGVKLVDGQEIQSFITVSNADPKRTYLSLVGAEHLDDKFVQRVENLSTKITDIKLLAALRELPDFSAYLDKGYDPKRIATFHIMPSVEYAQKSSDDAMAGRVTDCPSMGVQIPSIYDPSLAPAGHHVLSADCHAYPGVLREGSWEEAGQMVGEQLIDTLSQYAPNFRDSIIHWTVQTPKDIEIREAMTDGNLQHIDDPPHQRMAGRVPYRAPIQQLYLCGSGTHPGGEVTGAPGHNAAKAILKDLEREVASQAFR